jgi:putative FmdB family regulatory protein
MPSYDYKCKSCSHVREIKHTMNETPVIYCDNCGKEMEKIITSAPQITWRGEWFANKGKY